jgi:hypothetical protein
MNEVDMQKCLVCVQSKMHHKLFKSRASHWADKPGHLIHSDLGFYEGISCKGSKYYVTFVANFSKFVSVFPMKSKSQVFSCLKLVRASFEKDKQFTILSL